MLVGRVIGASISCCSVSLGLSCEVLVVFNFRLLNNFCNRSCKWVLGWCILTNCGTFAYIRPQYFCGFVKEQQSLNHSLNDGTQR